MGREIRLWFTWVTWFLVARARNTGGGWHRYRRRRNGPLVLTGADFDLIWERQRSRGVERRAETGRGEQI